MLIPAHLNTDLESDEPLQERALEYFEEEVKKRLLATYQEINQQPLFILVWGPGKSHGDLYQKCLYQKRVQIRNALRRRGHLALFSEELETPKLRSSEPLSQQVVEPLSQRVAEYVQVKFADCIIVIAASYGSIAEVHDFKESAIANKMLIFVDESTKDGYSYRGVISELGNVYNNVETYRYPIDIEACNLMTKVLKKTEWMRQLKWLENKQKGFSK